MYHKIYDLTNLFVSRYLPSSDGVKDMVMALASWVMTHEAKAKAMTHKAKDLTLRRHLFVL